MSTPAVQSLTRAPVVECLDDFASDAELDHVRALAADEAALRARGSNPHVDAAGFVAEVPTANDAILLALEARIQRAIGLTSVHAGMLRLRRYEVGQGHGVHKDNYDIQGASLVASAALYVDEPEAGGETAFPEALPRPVSVAAKRGRLVYWFNHLPDGGEDAAARHESVAVRAGTKLVLLAFVYRPLDDWRAAKALHRRELKARRDPWRELVCVDDGVPAETVRLLREACQARGVAFEHLHARRFDHASRRRLRPGTLLFRPAISMTSIRVEQALFQPGVATFYRDPAGAWFGYGNAQRAFEHAGVPIPRMVPCDTRERDELKRYAEFVGGFPLVLKLPGGSGGVGVLRIDSLAGLYSTVDWIWSQGRTAHLMAFVPDAIHWRVVVVGDRAVAAYRNHEDEDDFRTHAKGDRADYTADVPPRLAEVAVRAARALRLEHAGVDVLEHRSGRPYVLEANFPCYYAQAQLAAGIDVAGAMVDHLVAKGERLAAEAGERARLATTELAAHLERSPWDAPPVITDR